MSTMGEFYTENTLLEIDVMIIQYIKGRTMSLKELKNLFVGNKITYSTEYIKEEVLIYKSTAMKKSCVTFILLAFMSLCQNVCAQTCVHTKKQGTLSALLSQEQKDTVRHLEIHGKLNSDDLILLRRMAGYKETGHSTGKLETLDLRNAKFVKDDNPYQVLDTRAEHIVAYAVSQRWNTTYAGPEWSISTGSLEAGTAKVGSLHDDVAYYEPMYVIFGKSFPDSLVLNRENTVDFSQTLTETEVRRLRGKNLKDIRGHILSDTDGRYSLVCSLQKNTFCYDMFYGCVQLKAVALPYRCKINNQIAFENDNIRYYIFSNGNKDNELQPVTVYFKNGKMDANIKEILE